MNTFIARNPYVILITAWLAVDIRLLTRIEFGMAVLLESCVVRVRRA